MANEKRLIDANALDERFNKRIKWLRLDVHDKYSLGLYHGAATDKDLIGEMPTVDAVPVVHGRWEDSIDEWFETDVYTCSKCRESYVLVEGTPKENLWHYCPNCGAKMDGGEDHTVS